MAIPMKLINKAKALKALENLPLGHKIYFKKCYRTEHCQCGCGGSIYYIAEYDTPIFAYVVGHRLLDFKTFGKPDEAASTNAEPALIVCEDPWQNPFAVRLADLSL